MEKCFDKAVERARSTNKTLVIFGNHPIIPYEVTYIEITTKEAALKFFADGAKVSKDDMIMFECDLFSTIKDFTVVENCLKHLTPENLFFCPKPFYSMTAYINFTNALQEHGGKGPEKIFIFYPPCNKFVYMVDNPLARYNRMICGGIGALVFLWFALLRFNSEILQHHH